MSTMILYKCHCDNDFDVGTFEEEDNKNGDNIPLVRMKKNKQKETEKDTMKTMTWIQTRKSVTRMEMG